MRVRFAAMVAVLNTWFATVVLWVDAKAPRDGVASEVALAHRTTSGDRHSLLIEVKAPAGESVDAIRMQLPRSPKGDLSAPLLPLGWKVRRAKRTLELSGPPARLPLWARLDFEQWPAIGSAEVSVEAAGVALVSGKVAIAELPPVEVQHSLDGLLLFPPAVSPGEEIEMELFDSQRLPEGGRWTIAGTTVFAETPSESNAPGAVSGASQTGTSRSRIRAVLPHLLEPGTPVSVSYVDAWGELILDVPAVEGTRVVEPPSATPPRLLGCGAYALAGDVLCACGLFPRATWNQVSIDGRPAGPPLSASSRTLYLRVPGQIRPGMHVISGNPAAGFPASDQIVTTFLSLRGESESRAMVRGQFGMTRFVVEGSEEPVPLRLVNQTPEVVALEGGNNQHALTAGGSPNLLERSVHALRAGGFNVQYRLDVPACPCASKVEPDVTSALPAAQSMPGVNEWASAGDFVRGQILAVIPLASPEAMANTAEALARKYGLRVAAVHSLRLSNDGVIDFQVSKPEETDMKLAGLEADARVRFAQRNRVFLTSALSSGVSGPVEYGRGLIHADRLPGAVTGEGVKVALIDTGVDTEHPALKGKVVEQLSATEYKFTPDIHGTLIAGIIAAGAAPQAEMEGVARRASLLAIKACQPLSSQAISSACWSLTLARALDLAAQSEAQVVNLSISGFEDKLVSRVLHAAEQRGMTLLAAAGNEGPEGKATFPAASPDVIAVTAVDAAEKLFSAATRGDFVDLAAPGVDIVSTAPHKQYLVFSGTSAATAFATGAVALLLQQQPKLSPLAVQRLLEQTAKDLGTPGKDPQFGYGLIDACKAVAQVNGDRNQCR